MYDIVIEDYPLRGSTMPLLRGAKSEREEWRKKAFILLNTAEKVRAI